MKRAFLFSIKKPPQLAIGLDEMAIGALGKCLLLPK